MCQGPAVGPRIAGRHNATPAISQACPLLSPSSEATLARRVLAEKLNNSSVRDSGGEPADHWTGVGYGRLWAVGASRSSFLSVRCRACAKNILLAREAHSTATIADLFATGRLPGNLRAGHGRNDELLERVYIGRGFRNDTERLEKVLEPYTKMEGSGTVTYAALGCISRAITLDSSASASRSERGTTGSRWDILLTRSTPGMDRERTACRVRVAPARH